MNRDAIGTAGFVAMLALACAPDSGPDSAAARDAVLFSESPAAWFEVYSTRLELSPDGSRAFLDYRRLIDLRTGTESPPVAGVDAAFIGTFDHLGAHVVAARRDGEAGWFRVDESSGDVTRLESVPPGLFLAWSRSGERIAYPSRADRSVLLVGSTGEAPEPKTYPLPAISSAAAWLPGDTALLVLVTDERGVSSLLALDPGTGDVRTVADELDGPWSGATLAVSEDAGVAYVALASPGAPEPEVRHEPYADRDLDIYEIDLATGGRRPVVQSPAEELAPALAGGALHWVRIESRMEAVILPFEGGEARVVAKDVQGPTWRPDGRALGVTTGGWRMADWALNLDGGVVEIHEDGRPASPVVPIITGYHEDFSPVWSPDGTWIAYHSHRSAGPVSGYSSEGSTDDIYLRRPDAPTSEEIRLTDFGFEVGTPDWAPDGRRMVLDSWNEAGGVDAWIVELDPETGTPLGRSRVPPPEDARGSPAMAAWSPVRDEIAIVFASSAGFASTGERELELWILAPDGSNARRIAAYRGHRYGGVDWSAEGETLVYSAIVDDRAQLFSIPRAGGEPRRLTDDAANLLHPQVSPDGRWVAATRILHEKRILRRSLAPSPGG